VTRDTNDPRAWQRPHDRGARPSSARLVDPEDDLASSTFGGEMETTTFNRYSSGPTPIGASGGAEPLPYHEPGRQLGPFSAEPTAIEPPESVEQRVRAARRRGTQDLGLMILRVGLGALLIGHGLQKAFGWWDGPGLSGFENTLNGMGYQHATILAYVGTGTELGAGALLVLGLFTPVAAAAALAFLINALLAVIAADRPVGHFPFFRPTGHEFELTLVVVAGVLVLTGPGLYGFDAGRRWARRPFVGSFLALLLGIGVGAAVWAFLNGTNPLG
jgi:putative oxidoreductase